MLSEAAGRSEYGSEKLAQSDVQMPTALTPSSDEGRGRSNSANAYGEVRRRFFTAGMFFNSGICDIPFSS